MKIDLSNKTALITGSTSGIGLGIAKQLAAHSCNIILNGFGNEDDINKIKSEISDKYKVKTYYHGADLSKKDQILDLVSYTQKENISVDILINNAGIQFVSPIEDFPDEKWDQILNINLSSAFYLIKNFAPNMKKNKWGRIINIASAHGIVASANKSAYVASKHGIVGLTKVVALEHAEFGVTANSICPGWVLTPLVQKQIDDIAAKNNISNDEAVIKLVGEKQPSKKFTNPEDVGAMVVHLCSDFSHNITGTSISMDGGWTAV